MGELEKSSRVVSDLLCRFAVRVRVRLVDGTASDWATWLLHPTDGFIEIPSLGPLEIASVAALEIDPVEIRRMGRLLPVRRVDHTEEVAAALSTAGVEFEGEGGVLRLRGHTR